jgi:hypothetical protein
MQCNYIINQQKARRLTLSPKLLLNDLEAKDPCQLHDKILVHIERKQQKYLACQVFSWILHAPRTLLMAELRKALAIEPQKHCLETTKLYKGDRIVKACAGFVIWDKPTDIVRFPHSTISDFVQPHCTLQPGIV